MQDETFQLQSRDCKSILDVKNVFNLFLDQQDVYFL